MLLLLGTLALVLAACSGGGPAATPAASAPAAGEVLARSAQTMAGVTSFRFTVENVGGETPLTAGLAMRSASGAMARPDRLTAEIKAVVSGFLVDVKVISVGGRTFLSNPVTGAFQTYDTKASPVAFFDPSRGAAAILAGVTGATLAGEGAVAGAPSYRVTGRVPAEAVQFIAGSFAEGSVLEAELFIGQRDALLRQVTLRGRITPTEPEGIVRVLTFSDFNQPFTIEPPA